MAQSLVKLNIHVIFSTKHRSPIITGSYENELHTYLGGICSNLECNPIKIGGYTDHVHVFCNLSKKITLIKLVEDLKSDSSAWMKTKDQSLKSFYWQNGYGAFSINPSEIDTVIRYIANQHEHHRKVTFQDEYKAFLKKYKVNFEERYLWD